MNATRVIAFANQKGGVGKTTTAVSLAACLAEKGLKILLIDFDPQSNATSAVGVGRQESHSVYPALLGEGNLKNEIRNTAIPNLDLIPSELDLAGAEVDIARSEHYLHCFKNVLADLLAATDYDFIFIDCPPSLGILTSNVLMAAEGVIIPVQCEYLALEGLSMITDLIKRLAAVGNARLKLDGIVMTMFDGRTNLSSEVVEEVKKHFGQLVYKTWIPRSVRISEAPSYGQPITVYDGHSTGAVAYRALAKEFLWRHRKTEDGPDKDDDRRQPAHRSPLGEGGTTDDSPEKMGAEKDDRRQTMDGEPDKENPGSQTPDARPEKTGTTAEDSGVQGSEDKTDGGNQ